MKLKTYILIVTLGSIIVVAVLGFTSQYTSRLEQDTQLYHHAEFDLTFQYPADWEIEERYGRRPSDPSQLVSPGGEHRLPLQRDNSMGDDEDPDVMRFQIILRSPSEESVTITLFPKPTNLEEQIQGIDPYAFHEGQLSFDRPNALVNGIEGYMWRTMEGAQEGIILVFTGDAYLYQVGFSADGPDQAEIRDLLQSISTGTGVDGQTILPVDVLQWDPNTPSTFLPEIGVLAASCTNCGETDAYSNSYTCCTSFVHSFTQ